MSAHRALFDLLAAPYLIPDPGAGGTILVDRQLCVVPVVTAAAEARTLAQPTKAGLIATVLLDADGGDLTLTVTGGWNLAGATTLTLGDAGESVTLKSVKAGASYYWRPLQAAPVSSASQAAAGTMTTVGANTGTAGAGLSLIGATNGGDVSGAIMNDLKALQEDIVAIATLLAAIRTALITANIIKGS